MHVNELKALHVSEVLKQAEELEITAKYITDQIKSVGERCMQAEPVRDSKGNEVPGEFQFREFGALKAWELLGKRIGYFKEDNAQKSVIIVPDLTPEERQKYRDEFNRGH